MLENTGASGISEQLDVLYDSTNPNIFTGDSYSAFDSVGYQNAINFVQTWLSIRKTHLMKDLHDLKKNSLFELSFVGNGARGLSGVNTQLSLVQQMLNSHPAAQRCQGEVITVL